MPANQDQTGHRNTNAIGDDDEFGVRQRLQTLTKSQYWLLLGVFAVAFTAVSLIWRTYWLPEKPIQWNQWSRFRAQQAISLKRPLLIFVQSDPENTDIENLKTKFETADIRQRFHIQSGLALEIGQSVSDDQLLWLFENRPSAGSYWISVRGAAPTPMDLEDESEMELLHRLDNNPQQEHIDED